MATPRFCFYALLLVLGATACAPTDNAQPPPARQPRRQRMVRRREADGRQRGVAVAGPRIDTSAFDPLVASVTWISQTRWLAGARTIPTSGS